MPATKPKSHLGTNIRLAREAARMTQLALGRAIGWTGDEVGAQICRFESGKTEPRISTLQRIAAALGVSLERLMMPPASRKRTWLPKG